MVLVIPPALRGRLGLTPPGVALLGAGLILAMTLFDRMVSRGTELAVRLRHGTRAVEVTAGLLSAAMGSYGLLVHLEQILYDRPPCRS